MKKQKDEMPKARDTPNGYDISDAYVTNPNRHKTDRHIDIARKHTAHPGTKITRQHFKASAVGQHT